MKSLLAAILIFGAMPYTSITYANNNLTDAHVTSVQSTKGGYESITKGRPSTTIDHGGAQMHIVTDEIGYGRNAQARLLGSPLREIGTQPLCNAKGHVSPCTGRGTIVGQRRTWDASGREGGNFEFLVIPNGVGGPKRVNLQIR